MNIAYEKDIVAWANEQAGFIRARRFDLLDLENIAEEIEDVGKSEQRELESRMAVLFAHLLKWKFQSERRFAIVARYGGQNANLGTRTDSEWFLILSKFCINNSRQ